MHISFDPFYFDPDDEVEVNDRTCWWLTGPDDESDCGFSLILGDLETWERLDCMSEEPEWEAPHSSDYFGQPFYRATTSKSYPWLSWVVRSGGGLDV